MHKKITFTIVLPVLLAALLPGVATSAGGSAGKDKSNSSVKFEYMTEKSGLTFQHERAEFAPQLENIMPWLTAGGAGVAVGDYNNDGRDDIYFTTSKLGATNHLYRNDGNFKFTEVGEELGIGRVNDNPVTGTSSFAMWFDADNDGWQDLFLLRFGMTSFFLNQQGKGFKEVTKKAGLLRRTNALSAIAFDYDNDGDLDIYIGGYFPEKDFNSTKSDSKVLFDSWETARNAGRNYLFKNNGKGKFKDVTKKAGLNDHGWAMAVGHADINNDGWQDIYIANDFGTDVVFKNLGNGKFEDISLTAIGVDTKKGMNTEFGDYNNDGLVDIYVTNMTEPYLHECNMLWRNNGNETFTDVSQETNSCDTDWGWGAKFVDINNDGLLDIYAANGFISAGKKEYMDILLDFIFQEGVDLTDAKQWPKMEGYSMAGYERNVLFIQTERGFENIAKSAGVDSILDSRGVAVSDFDEDGRMDLVVSNVAAPPDLYRNVSKQKGNWLQLELQALGKRINSSGIGAKVQLKANGETQYREVASASGFDSQSSLRLHFGLGESDKIDSLKVTWPNGKVEEFSGLEVNSIYHLSMGGKAVALKKGAEQKTAANKAALSLN